MKLLDFSALFQLCATFYVAFIVIEYAKSYTSILANNLFDFSGKLKTMSEDLKMKEEADLDEFQGDRFKSGKPFKFLESTKNKIVELNASIDTVNSELQKYISQRCRFEQFRNISIYMFVYCMEMLIWVGLVRWNNNFVYDYIRTHFYIALAFVTMSFFAGMTGCLSEVKHRTLNVVVTFVFLLISIIMSLLSAMGIWPQYEIPNKETLNIYILFTALLPLSVFLLGIIYVWVNGLVINNEINNRFKPIIEMRKKVLGLIDEWRTHDKAEDRYEDDDNDNDNDKASLGAKEKHLVK